MISKFINLFEAFQFPLACLGASMVLLLLCLLLWFVVRVVMDLCPRRPRFLLPHQRMLRDSLRRRAQILEIAAVRQHHQAENLLQQLKKCGFSAYGD
jgi:hypothetical protein